MTSLNSMADAAVVKGHLGCLLLVGDFAGTLATGRKTEKVVPFPISLFTSMSPPCCLMIPNETERPRPVPLASGLVVKKGLKTSDTLLFRYPDARVGELHGNQLPIAGIVAGNAQRPPIGHRVQRVQHDVEKHLLELLAVAVNRRQVGSQVALDLDICQLDLVGRQPQGVLDQILNLMRFRFDLALPGEVQQVAHDFLRPFGL